MTLDVNYFIRIKDHINKSDRIVSKITSLDTYIADFNTIINFLNKDNQYLVTLTNGEAELTKSETVTVPGYIYNSSKNITTPVYNLSLVKIDTQLSELFQYKSIDKETQTINTENASDIHSKETQFEQDSESKLSQTDEEHDEEEFGEFQGYTSCPTPEFVNINLNECSPSYYNNVIIPPCPSYNPYESNSFSYNPFTNIMNLRGENDDVHFTFETGRGSQVPSNPTQIAPTWGPELISELKFRLAQPNAGLLPTNANYFL